MSEPRATEQGGELPSIDESSVAADEGPIADESAIDDFFASAAMSDVVPAEAVLAPEPAVEVATQPAVAPSGPRPSLRDRRAATKLRARRVRRIVRHVEPWSVLKITLIFYFCLWVIFLVAGLLLWSAAVGSGTIDNIESFIAELFALEEFTFDADQIFRSAAIAGLIMVIAGTGFTVLLAVLFNLISDLTGGLRITVIEEESARVAVRRR